MKTPRILFLLFCLQFGSTAGASSWIIIANGQVNNGIDRLGYFGDAGEDSFSGKIQVKFYYNIPSPGATLIEESTGGGQNSYYVGYGAASPIKSIISINGISRKITGDYSDIEHWNDVLFFDQLTYRVTNSFVEKESGVDMTIINLQKSIFSSSNFETPYAYTAGPEDIVQAYFYFGLGPITTRGNISVTDVTLRAYVPEPHTWVTFLLGFAVVGAAGRRRSRKMFTLNQFRIT